MAVSRRNFLKLTIRGSVVIGVAHSLNSCTDEGVLPRTQLRFAIASDGHYGQPETPYEFYHDQMITWLNEEQKKNGLDFTFINGDLFHDDILFLQSVKKKWDELKMSYYVSHGNHDISDEEKWQQTWNTPWNFAFEKNDAAFLVLNTSDGKGKDIRPDIDWTKEQLTRYQNMKHLFVFMHITPFSWTTGGSPYPELVELFEDQKNLKAIFHGHDHNEDGVKLNNGKYYFFDSHIGSDWGTHYQGYRIVEVSANGDILTYQMNPSTQQQVNDNNI